ncbi:M28 family metallopeptidase [Belliella pelovolcani]|uniref:Zn-dependent amino-or carboxypeptidase, M28 family n=1 Tax=Belliella pelovolcani TaxID=529505 RepID=A0A1N7NPS1_9BACT|nr:M28 family metallopeptidase [Belliella pelovolcani]SIT00219.1 Zn-dependent amino-or carboxypeptidase, M28 family [Belliella pelovolcani]
MKNQIHYLLSLSIATIFFSACQYQVTDTYQFQVEDIEDHIITLSSDDFLGRMPFTKGEELTTSYLVNEFKSLGLEPGNGDSFFQEVPMVSILATPAAQMKISSEKEKIVLEGLKDYVIWTQRTDPSVSFEDAELVFAGFGIVAPEYGWDDYKGLNVKDKIVVVLVNDPGFGTEDEAFFKGNTMTYYGRWTYKYEEAIRQGALGCLIVHNTIPAGYGFNVVQNSWNASKLYLDDRGKESYKLAFEGWITLPIANRLFEMAGLNEREMLAKARKVDFEPIPMNLKAASTIDVSASYNISKNVIAKITGKTAPDEVIIYTAHWDHLGIGKPDELGDSLYNGALDNASGTAALLAMAKAFKNDTQTDRTVAFLAVTAEEQGLWGSAYYAQNPIFPKEKTVANINMDGINPYGKMKDVSLIGMGQSSLEDILIEELDKVGRYASPDPTPSAGFYFRSDHFNFAKIGIPALYIGTGIDHFEKGKEYGKQLQDDYTAKYYHKPSDEYDPSRWNLDGAVEDVQLLYQVGRRLANDSKWPQWKPGSEFKAVREEYLNK